jgi:hypothetical protein
MLSRGITPKCPYFRLSFSSHSTNTTVAFMADIFLVGWILEASG